VILIAGAAWFWRSRRPLPGTVTDEASRAGLDIRLFNAPDDNYFSAMDGGILLRTDEEKGRNTWMAWTGGNDRFWDQLAHATSGTFDLLKIVSSYDPAKDLSLSQPDVEPLRKIYPFRRSNRWAYFGLINDPCFQAPGEGDGRHHGLWLDQRLDACRPDPFKDEQKFPGVAVGARGRQTPAGSLYGEPAGILGLRLFPNPDFDQAAARKWDPVRYYKDPSYFLSKDLVRPYRVGVTCAFCHAGFNPLNPPKDPENPEWVNLSSTAGAQHFRAGRIFSWQGDTGNFVFQMMQTSRPGSLDASLAVTDHVHNPTAIPPLYGLTQRMRLARQWGKESLAGGALNNKQLSDYVAGGPLAEFFAAPATVWTPHMQHNGADSAGVLAAVNRAFLELGQFSEETSLHFNPLVGGLPGTPVDLTLARKNSVYWQLTEAQTADVVRFLLRNGDAPHLQDAQGAQAYLTDDAATITRGKTIFADRCARCHSSKLPVSEDAGPGNWNRYWEWSKTADFKQQMQRIAAAPDFLENNYLSADLRIPVTLLETNACSALGSNATAGNIWDNFSSQSYKDLPTAGAITYYHPETGVKLPFQLPAGGRGYTVAPSLLGLWSTAPYLLNNAVGRFEPDASVDASMRAFQDAIEQMLWPEKRDKDEKLGAGIPGKMDRTAARSYLRVPASLVPEPYRALLDQAGWLEIGPIPAGTPVGLLGSLDLVSDPKKALAVLLRVKKELGAVPKDASEEELKRVFAALVDPLLQLSTCPDFIANRGHYFGTSMFAGEPGLSDAEKRDLIAFLKRL
jgi:cytochrome c5